MGATHVRYKSVAVTRRGPPEVLEIVDNDLRAPSQKEVRVKVLASFVCGPDVQARYGQTPIAPKPPFVPGYAVVGTVDAVGEGITEAAVGDCVGALTVFGGYAEYAYLKQDTLIPLPDDLDPAVVITLILNYIVPYQVLHRSVRVEEGDRVLIVGASGGVGTGFLQLGKLAGLKMYGLASVSKHHVLTRYGAAPIDYRTQNFVEVIREAEPDGLDAVFDGMGGEYLERGFSVLGRGGTIVQYGNPLSFSGLARLLWRTLWWSVLPNGKRVKVYGTTTSKFGRQPYLADWATLFDLLRGCQIEPIIHARFSILEAAEANALLESGDVIGTIVLLAPELM